MTLWFIEGSGSLEDQEQNLGPDQQRPPSGNEMFFRSL